MQQYQRERSVVEDEDEVDEVGEDLPYEISRDIHPETLDDFFREQFQTSTLESNGMPSLSWIHKHFKTKSAAIRYLAFKGYKVKEISKHLGIRYQHVRNVLTTQLKRGPNENWNPNNFDNSSNLEKF